jgi:hypothetical protein
MTTKAAPLSIETLLQKQREEKEAASKVNGPFPRKEAILTVCSLDSYLRRNALRSPSRNVQRKSTKRNKERIMLEFNEKHLSGKLRS